MNIARPPVVSQAEWDAALAAITEREERVATAMHELVAARKRMPMVRVEHDYRFEGPDGQRTLPELFDGRRQLILYRFYFEEGVGGWPGSVPGAGDVSTKVADLGGSALAALLMLVVMGFIGELFNNTMETNYDRILAWWQKSWVGRVGRGIGGLFGGGAA